jgi:hypothetical protein
VGLRTTTVVWLESTLRHGDLLLLVEQSMCLGTQAVSLLPFPMQSNLLNLRPITEVGQVIEAVLGKNFGVLHKSYKKFVNDTPEQFAFK